MSFEVVGRVHKIYDTESKGANNFQAREFVIEVSGMYPQFVKFQLTQDRCALMDTYGVDQNIKVYFDLRGREWNEKFFTNLNAWKIEAAEAAQTSTPPPAAPAAANNSFPTTSDAPATTAADDLPF